MRTGRFRFVRNWFGQMVLEVEIREPTDQYCVTWTRRWIRGTASDAADIMETLDGYKRGRRIKCGSFTG